MRRKTRSLCTLVLAVCLSFAFSTNSYAEDIAHEDKAEPDSIHGIYVSAYVAGTKNMMDEMIENIECRSF